MSKKELMLDDIKNRLFMLPKSLLESFIILNKKPSNAAINSSKRWVQMIIDTLEELEKALKYKEGN